MLCRRCGMDSSDTRTCEWCRKPILPAGVTISAREPAPRPPGPELARALQEQTGAPYPLCERALTETHGDVDTARALLAERVLCPQCMLGCLRTDTYCGRCGAALAGARSPTETLSSHSEPGTDRPAVSPGSPKQLASSTGAPKWLCRQALEACGQDVARASELVHRRTQCPSCGQLRLEIDPPCRCEQLRTPGPRPLQPLTPQPSQPRLSAPVVNSQATPPAGKRRWTAKEVFAEFITFIAEAHRVCGCGNLGCGYTLASRRGSYHGGWSRPSSEEPSRA